MSTATTDMTTDDASWAALDRLNAALSGDDPHEQVAAIENALDAWLASGDITTDDIRVAMLRPVQGLYVSHLDAAMRCMVELDPELAGEHADVAITKMDGRDGLSDAGWAALVLNAYRDAREALGLDQLMTAELRETLVRISRGIEARTDLACLLLYRHAHKSFSPAQGDHAEAWGTCKGARREAQDILELLGEPVDRSVLWYLQRRLLGDTE
jgi:hypothetical protein